MFSFMCKIENRWWRIHTIQLRLPCEMLWQLVLSVQQPFKWFYIWGETVLCSLDCTLRSPGCWVCGISRHSYWKFSWQCCNVLYIESQSLALSRESTSLCSSHSLYTYIVVYFWNGANTDSSMLSGKFLVLTPGCNRRPRLRIGPSAAAGLSESLSFNHM